VYVADNGNYVIRVVDLVSGMTSTVTGTPHVMGDKDGANGTAQFHSLSGITFDGSKNVLYVHDVDRVRIVDVATGAVSTLLGAVGHQGVRLGVPTTAALHHGGSIALIDGSDMLLSDTAENAVLRLRNF
jgi:hypothetical protein